MLSSDWGGTLTLGNVEGGWIMTGLAAAAPPSFVAAPPFSAELVATADAAAATGEAASEENFLLS